MITLWAEKATTELKGVKNVILPIGSTEQHGPHMPVGTDTYLTDWAMSSLVGEDVGEDFYILPTIPYGKSIEHLSYPGTITLGMNTLTMIIEDIASSLSSGGVSRLVIISGHGGNAALIDAITYDIRKKYQMECYGINIGSVYPEKEIPKCAFPFSMHAGFAETSLMKALHGEKFAHLLDKTPKKISEESRGFELLSTLSHTSYGWATEDVSAEGYIGDPSDSNKEDGERIHLAVKEQILSVLRTIVGK